MRRDIILDVATQKFSEKGYSASLTEIAKASGIRKQTLYNYFENKDELFYEVISNETGKYFNDKRQEFRSYELLNAEKKLEKIFFSIITYFQDREKLLFWRWIILIDSEELRKKCAESIRTKEKGFAGFLSDIFARGVEDGEIREQPLQPLIHSYIALIHGALDGVLLYDKEFDSDPFVRNVWQVFWQGISNNAKFK